MRSLKWFAVFLAPLLVALALAASTGRVRLTVTDENGDPMVGASVKAIASATNHVQEATTDKKGKAIFIALEGGEIIFRVEYKGYQTLEKNFRVRAGTDVKLPLQLAPLVRVLTEEELNPDQRLAKASADGYNEAVALFKAGKHDEARAEIDQVLTDDPAFAPGFILQARLLTEAGSHSEAADAYLRAIELDPTLDSYMANLVGELLKADRHEEAKKYAELLDQRAAKNTNPDELFNSAVIKINQGDDPAALKYLEQVLAISADYAEAVYERGLIRLRMGQTAEAVEDMRRYLELAPEGANAGSAQGLIAAMGG